MYHTSYHIHSFYSCQVFQALHGDMAKREGFSILPILLSPSSRGNIRLDTADPFSEPLIDPNYLGSPDDANTLLEGKDILVSYIQCHIKLFQCRINTLHMFLNLFFWVISDASIFSCWKTLTFYGDHCFASENQFF